MHFLRFILGLILVLATLLDGFETILLPRRINHRLRYSRLYYRAFWRLWRRIAGQFPAGKWREATLGIFGPMSLMGLFVSWILTLIVGFALMQWATVQPLLGPHAPPGLEPSGFLDCLYFSGTTAFTLGLGDLTPRHGLARGLTVAECGVGFGFLAIIIGYLPVLYQAFSRREAAVSLMDARAGSPPSGGEFIVRIAKAGHAGPSAQGAQAAGDAGGKFTLADAVLRDWEQWCAELLESHVSFPVLAFYRSQHGNQSWVGSLATMLDASALLVTALPATESYQAQLTFAMARHAAVDICLIFQIHPQPPRIERLSSEARDRLCALLASHVPAAAPVPPTPPADRIVAPPAATGMVDEPSIAAAAKRLDELRAMYEPFLQGLADHFRLALGSILPTDPRTDNWQRSAWMPRTPGIGSLPAASPPAGAQTAGTPYGDHFSTLL